MQRLAIVSPWTMAEAKAAPESRRPTARRAPGDLVVVAEIGTCQERGVDALGLQPSGIWLTARALTPGDSLPFVAPGEGVVPDLIEYGNPGVRLDDQVRLVRDQRAQGSVDGCVRGVTHP
ncbi:MAG: hypothetical protein H6643_15415 [Caldilineaceae bacterium]|nr:hypothetical protein [Caldilineaceae bacterium]